MAALQGKGQPPPAGSIYGVRAGGRAVAGLEKMRRPQQMTLLLALPPFPKAKSPVAKDDDGGGGSKVWEKPFQRRRPPPESARRREGGKEQGESAKTALAAPFSLSLRRTMKRRRRHKRGERE